MYCLDFDQLCRVQRSRRQMQGRDVSLKQLYEIDTIIIESDGIPLLPTRIQTIVESVYEDVFTFTIKSNQTAYVEFIHADILEKWLSNSDIIEKNFNITLVPSVKCVDDENKTTVYHRLSDLKSMRSEGDTRSSTVTMDLRRQWAMIAGHRIFSIEYRDYIRKLSDR